MESQKSNKFSFDFLIKKILMDISKLNFSDVVLRTEKAKKLPQRAEKTGKMSRALCNHRFFFGKNIFIVATNIFSLPHCCCCCVTTMGLSIFFSVFQKKKRFSFYFLVKISSLKRSVRRVRDGNGEARRERKNQ